jgi:hypothetical protein
MLNPVRDCEYSTYEYVLTKSQQYKFYSALKTCKDVTIPSHDHPNPT